MVETWNVENVYKSGYRNKVLNKSNDIVKFLLMWDKKESSSVLQQSSQRVNKGPFINYNFTLNSHITYSNFYFEIF